MSWKKLFYAGAVLVLTACNNATAPSPSSLTKLDGGALKSTSPDTTVVIPINPITGPTDGDGCNGQLAHIGLGELPVLVCMPPSPGTTISW